MFFFLHENRINEKKNRLAQNMVVKTKVHTIE